MIADPQPSERIMLGDGRKAQLRTIASGDLVVTYGRGEGAEIYRSCAGDPIGARAEVMTWARSLRPRPPEPSGPVMLSIIDRAERIADYVDRMRMLRRELAVLEAEVERLMGGS
jgi:hypothetical protein